MPRKGKAPPPATSEDHDDGSAASPPASPAAPLPALPPSWQARLGPEREAPYFRDLAAFVAAERAAHEVFPPPEDVFRAFELTPYDDVKVVLLGQDPYHDVGQAHGLCFSVKEGVKPPPSLANMFKELRSDLGLPQPSSGSLSPWARQGVLLLNTVLTVRAHQAGSHKDHGWERFTDAAIRALDARPDPVVFALWGAQAQKKEKLVDTKKHVVLKTAHPSPLSLKQFLGSKPYSAINTALEKLGKPPIDWRLP